MHLSRVFIRKRIRKFRQVQVLNRLWNWGRLRRLIRWQQVASRNLSCVNWRSNLRRRTVFFQLLQFLNFKVRRLSCFDLWLLQIWQKVLILFDYNLNFIFLHVNFTLWFLSFKLFLIFKSWIIFCELNFLLGLIWFILISDYCGCIKVLFDIAFNLFCTLFPNFWRTALHDIV